MHAQHTNHQQYLSRHLPHCLCVFMCLYFANTALMAQTQVTAEVLVNNAYADGALIATANVCQIDKTQLNQLIFNQKKAALEAAKQHQLPFVAKDYDDYVVSGFESTMRVLTNQTEGEDVLATVCEGLAEKIAKKIAP
jgi:hypothetical protein